MTLCFPWAVPSHCPPHFFTFPPQPTWSRREKRYLASLTGESVSQAALRGRTGPTWGESTTCPQEQLQEPGPRDRTGNVQTVAQEGKVTFAGLCSQEPGSHVEEPRQHVLGAPFSKPRPCSEEPSRYRPGKACHSLRGFEVGGSPEALMFSPAQPVPSSSCSQG